MGTRFVVAVLAAVLSQIAFAQTADTLKSYSVEKKQEAVAAGKKAMSAIDRDIKKLERAASKASGDTKAQFKEEVKGLKADRAAVAKKLDAMGKASGEAWDGAKNAFADAYSDLHQGVEKAAKKLK